MSDIPKLPKFEPKLGSDEFLHTNNSHSKRPPPSKGLSIIKKINGNMSLVPHELSTIVEADSQLSAKVGSGPSPTASKASLSLSPLKDVALIKSQNYEGRMDKSERSILNQIDGAHSVEKSSSSKVSEQHMKTLFESCDQHSKSSGSCECSKTFHSLAESSKQYSSSSDDIEAIEMMLKSIGMEWAIPTLHKTKEALALSSSSSSSDLSLKNKIFGNDSNVSGISLKALLSKYLFNKVSSSTLISDSSPVSALGELSELSGIHVNSKDRQRTSTPLTVSKTTSRSKEGEFFSMDSDISSVKNTGSCN